MTTLATTPRIWNEYTRIETSYEGRIFYDCYEVSGLMKYMRGCEIAVGIFGQFEVTYDENTNKKIVRWTVYLGTDKERKQYGIENWIDCHESSCGEWWDDLSALKSGNVEYIY